MKISTSDNHSFSYSESSRNDSELSIYQYGWEKCKPLYVFGPSIRDHFLIHYVVSGKGVFEVDGKEYHLTTNQGFIIYPKVLTVYRADEEDPWEYYWIGFNGSKAEDYIQMTGLSRNNPIFTYDQDNYLIDCMKGLCQTNENPRSAHLSKKGYLFLFISRLIDSAINNNYEQTENDKTAVEEAIKYIEGNFSRDISVIDIANHVGFSRTHFTRIFTKHLHVPPYEFLTRLRISKACEYLVESKINISETATSVGYKDIARFSKMFKLVTGETPMHFRNRPDVKK